MHVNINSKGNTGSSSNLTNYLNKEQEHEFFNHNQNHIQSEVVTAEIDRYAKGQLAKTDTKFYEIEYNPSEKEQKAIIERATGRTDITSYSQLSEFQIKAVKQEFAEFVRKAQDQQAKNYNREKIQSGADLKWYGKIEMERRYKGFDNEVKQGQAKSGDLKQGLNMHVHIIQSRKAMDKKTKLSPQSKHRKQSSKNPVKQGFDRQAFANRIEKTFDKHYNHKRELSETYEFKKAEKYNRLEDLQRLKNEWKEKHKDKKQEKKQTIKTERKQSHQHKQQEQKRRNYGHRR